jgi:hypothetical protein
MISKSLFPEEEKMMVEIEAFCKSNYPDTSEILIDMFRTNIQMALFIGGTKVNDLLIGKNKQKAKEIYLDVQLELMEIDTINKMTEDKKGLTK